MTASLDGYQQSVAEYWDQEEFPVNRRLGDIDGLYHHHYGVGPVQVPAPAGDEAIAAELHRLETAQADLLLDQLGDIRSCDLLLDAGCGEGALSVMAATRFGCRVHGVTISTKQLESAVVTARRFEVADRVGFALEDMQHTTLPTGGCAAVWTDESDMYVDLDQMLEEFRRILRVGGRYVAVTGVTNDVLGEKAPEVRALDEFYRISIHPRSRFFRALAEHGFTPLCVQDLTDDTTPYWQLRADSNLTNGVEQPYLTCYRRRTMLYMLIVAEKLP
ncbi:SAM-dependent methyltransferase [Nocardia brasiliensis]|uniref:SAM-dependent methyltransferase n=1 Tax=Nocardia brasiliensis TaxID=37326 RepID=UPI0024578E98|nr:class I SAM-dependent methyltransferase [Nocardia brasiliensis]